MVKVLQGEAEPPAAVDAGCAYEALGPGERRILRVPQEYGERARVPTRNMVEGRSALHRHDYRAVRGVHRHPPKHLRRRDPGEGADLIRFAFKFQSPLHNQN